MPIQHAYVEAVSACNLACPSCPNGNMREARRRPELLDPALFERLAGKLARELPDGDRTIHLYNWGEPLLHPELPALVRIAHAAAFRCSVSTNLNHRRDLQAIVDAAPDTIRVSLSGYGPATYAVAHRGGDGAVVLRHLEDLARARARSFARPRVEVLYHLYRHNGGEDLERMRATCDRLGFELAPAWAFLMPAEQSLAWLEGRRDAEVADAVGALVLAPEELRDLALARPECRARCPQLDVLAIDVHGRADLCCATYSIPPVAASFLDAPLADVQRARDAHPFCARCRAHGLHVTYAYGGLAEWDRRARARLAALGTARAAEVHHVR